MGKCGNEISGCAGSTRGWCEERSVQRPQEVGLPRVEVLLLREGRAVEVSGRQTALRLRRGSLEGMLPQRPCSVDVGGQRGVKWYEIEAWAYDKKKDECWLWNGYVNPRGYGIVRYSGRTMHAHRAFYLVMVGKIETGL